MKKKNREVEDESLQPLLFQIGHGDATPTLSERDTPTLIDPIPWPVPADMSEAVHRGPTNHTRVKMETMDDA